MTGALPGALPPTSKEHAREPLSAARQRVRDGDYVEGQRLLDRILESLGPDTSPAHAEVLFWRGLSRVRDGSEADGIDDLEAAAAQGWLEARFQLAQHDARRGRRTGALRQRAIAHLQHILAAPEPHDSLAAGIDRVCFALGGLYAEGDEPGDLERGIAAYRQGLSANPLSASGHNSLGQLLMRSGQPLGALGEFKVALQLDPDFRAAYGNLARLFFQRPQAPDLATEYGHIVEEFQERAPLVLARLSQELAELGREQVYRSLYTKGHQLKNLIGVVGSRLGRAARRAQDGDAALAQELGQIEGEHARLYEEWVGYLSTMTPDQLYTGLVDPARVARRVVEALGDAADPQGGGARLTIRVQDGVPRIEADERLLREAVTNLCLNALEAIGDGPPPGRVAVGVGFDGELGVVFIEVEDTGPGIAADVLDHVFDPGFTTKSQGNGYGLAIAQRIAHAHHGDLRVKSRVGHGTVFRLDLPVDFDADSGHGGGEPL